MKSRMDQALKIILKQMLSQLLLLLFTHPYPIPHAVVFPVAHRFQNTNKDNQNTINVPNKKSM